MKNLIIGLAMASLTACGNNNNAATTNSATKVVNNATSATLAVDATSVNSIQATTVKDIINAYLQMKNAFTNDNTNDAAAAGKTLHTALMNFDTKTLSPDKQKIFNDIADDAKEHAEHIGANAGNIKHQREHFVMLSKDMADLIKSFGNGGQTLYKDFCPMADNGKGAIWISEIKNIKNPYLGKAMPACGSVKEEIKQ